MKQVTIESVRERIAELDCLKGDGVLSLRGEFELACLRQLLASLKVKPELWEIDNPGEGTYFVYDAPHDQDWRKNMIVQRWYAEPPVPTERNQVRADHAEWSQATFGNVGPIGPLKHLAKEAMEAAAAPDDLSEWADMQFLLWDAQRRAGITDEQITQAMIEKLAVNKARQWPEPKDGEPRLHVKEQPAPVAVYFSTPSGRHDWVGERFISDNTAQQFEALATSAQPEIIGYEHRLICGELRRVPKFKSTSAGSGKP